MLQAKRPHFRHGRGIASPQREVLAFACCLGDLRETRKHNHDSIREQNL